MLLLLAPEDAAAIMEAFDGKDSSMLKTLEAIAVTRERCWKAICQTCSADCKHRGQVLNGQIKSCPSLHAGPESKRVQ